MASLVSATNGTHQEVEITSKAARVILYNADGSQLTSIPVSGTVAISGTVPVSGTFYQATQPVSLASPVLIERANLLVTATGATAAAVTLTLPAVASQFHNIASLRIEAYSTAARTGSATPVIVTTTNLNSLAYTFATAAAIGSVDSKVDLPVLPVRSVTVNTATTIVCPATTGIIWRVTAIYNTSI